MTQPVPPTQASNAQVAAVLTVLAASGSATSAAPLAAALGIPVAVAAALLKLSLSAPTLRLPAGPSANIVNEAEQVYRAAYLANAGLRMKARLDAGQTPDEAAAPERALFRAHRAAQAGRARASAAVDGLARRVGLRLRWRAVNDAKTSPECRAANGHVFTADQPPAIGLPGAVHPHCRCRPVPASDGVGTVTVDQAVRAARITEHAA